MLKYLLCALVIGVATGILKVGYYTSLLDEEPRTHFFIKHALSVQMQFHNLFANEGDPKPLQALRADERRLVIDYCRYRLGIETRLQTQAELDACSAR